MKEPLFKRIAPFSKKDRVVAAIRDAIMSGRMKPGDPLVETRLARQLGVGQPLIRDALLAPRASGLRPARPLPRHHRHQAGNR